MSTVLAITPIRHGNADGTVTEVGIGADVEKLDGADPQALIDAGSAVELGEPKRYSSAPGSPGAPTGPVDQDTLKRDQILRQAITGTGDTQAETAENAESSGPAAAGAASPASATKPIQPDGDDSGSDTE